MVTTASRREQRASQASHNRSVDARHRRASATSLCFRRSPPDCGHVLYSRQRASNKTGMRWTVLNRAGLILLTVLQTLLLYLTTSAWAGSGALYGCALLCGTPGAYTVIPRIGALFGLAMFLIPTAVGALSHTWQGAVAFAVVPWWVVVVGHAGTLLMPVIVLGGRGGSFDVPFWLNDNRVVPLLLSLVLFALLGWLGWLVRDAFQQEWTRRAGA